MKAKQHLAIPSKTQAITTNRIIQEALGKKLQRALQMEVSRFMEEFGWIKKQKRVNGKPEYVWSNPSLLTNPTQIAQEVVTQSKSLETIDTQALSQPILTESVIEEQIVHGYLPYGQEDVEQVRETLLIDVKCDLDLDLAGVYSNWEKQFSLEIFEKACQTIPIKTINLLQDLASQVKAVLRYQTPVSKYEILRDIDCDYVCDVYGASLAVGSTVKPYGQIPHIEGRPLGEIIKIEKCNNERIRVVVQWKEVEKTSEYFGKSRIETEGSYFVNIKELRKMILKDGKWVVAT